MTRQLLPELLLLLLLLKGVLQHLQRVRLQNGYPWLLHLRCNCKLLLLLR
jgi:hypothetical protein